MNEKLKVAIVDDNPQYSKTLGEFFGEKTDVTLFQSGEDALDALSHTPFHAYVVDTVLGRGMDGFTTAEEIRKIDAHAVILGISWLNELERITRADEYRTWYQRVGADDFMNSADGADAVVARVRELLNR